MSVISIAVRLRAPDPAAVTALAALRRVLPGACPLELQRYEHWEFSGSGCGTDVVEAIVSRFDDIVNPNKQTWAFPGAGALQGEDPGLVWCGIRVTDREDSVSENWTAILHRAGFPVERVVHSVLWRAGFPEGTPPEEASRRAAALAVTHRRDGGLLANPVSQTVSMTDPV